MYGHDAGEPCPSLYYTKLILPYSVVQFLQFMRGCCVKGDRTVPYYSFMGWVSATKENKC